MGVVKPCERDPSVITLYFFAHESCKKLSHRFIDFVDPEDEQTHLAGSLGFIGIIKKR